MFTPRFDQTYFELFNLEPKFDLDEPALGSSYRSLLREVHPDKFINADDRDKRVSLQYSAFVNQAHDCLKHDLSRALYLLELMGSVEQPVTPADFLMQQIEMREELQDCVSVANSGTSLKTFRGKVLEEHDIIISALSEAFTNKDTSSAAELVVKLQFLDKLAQEADELIFEALDNQVEAHVPATDI